MSQAFKVIWPLRQHSLKQICNTRPAPSLARLGHRDEHSHPRIKLSGMQSALLHGMQSQFPSHPTKYMEM